MLLLSGMLLSFPQPPNLLMSNNLSDKHHLVTFFFLSNFFKSLLTNSDISSALWQQKAKRPK